MSFSGTTVLPDKVLRQFRNTGTQLEACDSLACDDLKRGLECYSPYLVPRMGRRSALGQATAACWGERRRNAIPWCTVHHCPPVETQKLKKPIFFRCFEYHCCQASSRTKQNETRFSTGPPSGEREVHSPSPDKQSPPSLGRPSQGLLHLRLTPGLAGAWTGWASCLQPAPWSCLVEGTGGRPRRWAGWGAATGVEAAGFLQGMMYLIASVCFCAAENCWAKLSTASPVCDTGAFRNCTFSCSFMSARHSQRWCSCTTSVDIAQPRDCVVTFVT